MRFVRPHWCSVVTVVLLQLIATLAALSFYRKVEPLPALDRACWGMSTLKTRNTIDAQQVRMLALMTVTFRVATPIMCVAGIVLVVQVD